MKALTLTSYHVCFDISMYVCAKTTWVMYLPNNIASLKVRKLSFWRQRKIMKQEKMESETESDKVP